MARAIIRTSINGPSPNNKQADLRRILERDYGLTRIGTGAYEGDFESEADAYNAIGATLNFLNALPSGFQLDHLWVYVDEVDRF